MGKQLDDLVNDAMSAHFVEEALANGVSKERMGAMKEHIRVQLIQDVKAEVEAEFLADELAKMRAKVQEEEEDLKTQYALKNIRSILLDGFLVALIVGLLVNQSTDLFTSFKNWSITPWFATWTIIFLLALLGLLYCIIQIRIIGQIAELRKKKGKKNEPN